MPITPPAPRSTLDAMTGRDARVHANGTRRRFAQNGKTGVTSV